MPTPEENEQEIRVLRREVAELAELVLRLAERMKFASIVFDASVQAARLRAGETERDFKCATFAPDTIPPEIRARMDADRDRAERLAENAPTDYPSDTNDNPKEKS